MKINQEPGIVFNMATLKPIILGKTVDYKGIKIICQNVRELFQFFLLWEDGEYRSAHFEIKDQRGNFSNSELEAGYGTILNMAISTVDTLMAMKEKSAKSLKTNKEAVRIEKALSPKVSNPPPLKGNRTKKGPKKQK